MQAIQATDRQFSSETVGRIRLGHSKFLIPDMNRTTTPLLAATLRSFDIDAQILPTYRGLDLAKKFTSGKECFPCQVTLGDLLCFIEEEKSGWARRLIPAATSTSCRKPKGPAGSACTTSTRGSCWIPSRS